MATDDRAREDLAFCIFFALKHKVIYRETKKAIRSLPEGHIEKMADEIAEHLLMCGWQHVPKPMGGHMDGMPPRKEPKV